MTNVMARRVPQAWDAGSTGMGGSRRLLGTLADGLLQWLWPACSVVGQRPSTAGHYDLPTYRRRGIRIPELDREG
jgi:hypothetical protein